MLEAQKDVETASRVVRLPVSPLAHGKIKFPFAENALPSIAGPFGEQDACHKLDNALSFSPRVKAAAAKGISRQQSGLFETWVC